MPTTTISINTKDPRDVSASKLFRDARSWAKCTVMIPGVGPVKAYGIPSRSEPNVYRLANLKQCNCPDFMFRQGIQSDGTYFKCAHIRAVKWYVEYVKAERRKEAALAAEEAARQARAEREYRETAAHGLVDAF